MNHIAFDSNGMILFAQQNSYPGVVLPAIQGATVAECTDADFALAHPAVGSPAAYWDGAKVVAAPASPGSSYSWDWPTKTWKLDLATGQAAAWARIKAARDAAINAGVTYNGDVYDSDATAQLRVTGAAQTAQLQIAAGNAAFSITWTLQNNSTVVLTAQEVIDMALAVSANYQALFSKGQGLRAQIAAATTQAQLDAIVW